MNRLVGVAALSLTAATVLHAQTRMRTGFTNPYNTCQGVVLGLRGGAAGTVAFVRQVDPLSPEALAGLRTGDTIVVMNGIEVGRPWPAGRPTAWRYAPGDTNVYEVRGGTGPRRITFVVGEWHDVPADSTANAPDGRPARRLCRPRVLPLTNTQGVLQYRSRRVSLIRGFFPRVQRMSRVGEADE